MSKSTNQTRREIEFGLNDLLERYKQKLELIEAEETHGEELDEDFIAEKITKLEEVIEAVGDVLDDLSYIE